ncbi:MAG: efflux RND transporter periplasmic adaptor subunit [Nitrospirae bacterium]|nr:efflux RND transporter periplasmic adaptor subunit [Candidatus Manganitrophaceae bacterium]
MRNNLVFIGIALLLGLSGGYWFANKNPNQTAKLSAEETGPKPLFYRHPMKPGMTSPTPKTDDMGMTYVPVYAKDTNDNSVKGTVKIDPVMTQNIGVRTAVAEIKTLSRVIKTIGRVDYDEERLSRLHPKTQGWIEKLYIDKTGQPVSKNMLLLSIYSPQLVTSQQEYLLALDNQKVLADSPIEDIQKGALALVASSRERLELLDVAEHQIVELEKDRQIKQYLHIHSPFEGFVLKIGARQGQFVTPKTELYRIAGLSKVWVYVDIYEYELPWISVGDTGEMTLTALPGKTFTGKITYIYPYVEEKTRTIKVRLEFDNTKGLLKPDMYAEVRIQAAHQVDAVVIPSEAIMRADGREKVFIALDGGKFEPRPIKVGIEAGNLSQIIEGLRSGEKVVTSAQFLIDSESRLNEAVGKMLEPTKDDTSEDPLPLKEDGNTMEGMDMGGGS